MKILRSYADRFEQVSIDEAYLEVTEKTKKNYQRAKHLASAIKDSLLNQQQLTCSIGIGPNKLVAKIAASIQKPDGLTIVKPEQVRRFLAPLPVRSIIGVGKKTEKKLETFGVRTIGQLTRFDVQRLIDVFGKKLGVYFHNSSLGLDDEQLEERSEPESVSRISTLKEDSRKFAIILSEAHRLCDEVHSRLRNMGLLYRSVSIHVVARDLSVYTRSKTLENQVSSLETFKEIVKELFEKFLAESDVEIRRVGVKLSNLTKEEEQQKQITSFFGGSKN
jgi:DNA polymerase IV (DinB-like DNA polymerase)